MYAIPLSAPGFGHPFSTLKWGRAHGPNMLAGMRSAINGSIHQKNSRLENTHLILSDRRPQKGVRRRGLTIGGTGACRWSAGIGGLWTSPDRDDPKGPPKTKHGADIMQASDQKRACGRAERTCWWKYVCPIPLIPNRGFSNGTYLQGAQVRVALEHSRAQQVLNDGFHSTLGSCGVYYHWRIFGT